MLLDDVSQRHRDIFAENFARVLAATQKTQADVVQAMQITSSTVSDWANAKKYPRVDKMQRLADYLGVDLSELRDKPKDSSIPFWERYCSVCKSHSVEPNAKEVRDLLAVKSATTIPRWGSGSIPDIKTIRRIAEVFDTNELFLIGWSNDPSGMGADYWENLHQRFKKKGTEQPFTIPVLGQIAAGFPLFAEENIEGYVTVGGLPNGGTYFALRVVGDSMNAAHVINGSLVVIREQPEVNNGEIAVVMVGDDEATIKYYRKEGNIVKLLPRSTDPKHEPQIYDIRETHVHVVGKLMKVEIDAELLI